MSGRPMTFAVGVAFGREPIASMAADLRKSFGAAAVPDPEDPPPPGSMLLGRPIHDPEFLGRILVGGTGNHAILLWTRRHPVTAAEFYPGPHRRLTVQYFAGDAAVAVPKLAAAMAAMGGFLLDDALQGGGWTAVEPAEGREISPDERLWLDAAASIGVLAAASVLTGRDRAALEGLRDAIGRRLDASSGPLPGP